MNADEHLEDFKSFIKANGNSPNVQAMYFKRVRMFLEKRPEAMEAGEQGLRSIVDDYIASLPVTSGIGVTATAVRYYWNMRFGKPYFERYRFDDYDDPQSAISLRAEDLKSKGYRMFELPKWENTRSNVVYVER